MKKLIFGRCYSFYGDADHQVWLAECLALYADAGDLDPQVEVCIGRASSAGTPCAINPRAHRKFKHGMLTSFPSLDVYWAWLGNGRLKVEVVLRVRRGFKDRIKKLLSMEYASDVEYFEQLLHEFVLVPSTYFFKDVALMHAACMTVDGGAFLLAGTGGAGKSAAMLALRRHDRIGFVCDDIAVISAATPSVYANLAWPKIYGYDCVGNALKSELLAGRGWVDRAHFHIKSWINPSSTRRKIRPDHLYQQIESVSAPITCLYYVVRENVPNISMSCLDPADSVEMMVAVMSAEYSIFHDHLYWERYNALATARTAMLTMDEVVTNWRNVLSVSLASVRCIKLSVPFDMDHIAYRSRMAEILIAAAEPRV
jgi:hypothetical protein